MMSNQKDLSNFFVHEKGICESNKIGKGTRIWANTHILPDAKIGKDCNICDNVFIENDVIIRDRVTIKCGVQVWDGIRIENDVFIGPNATFTNDIFPRSKHYPKHFLSTIIQEGASIGANATILPDIKIGYNAMVSAGAVVTNDVPPNAIVMGNPARISGYIDTHTHTTATKGLVYPKDNITDKKPSSLGVGDCALWPLPHFNDLRGELTAIEFNSSLPFTPKRQFFVFAVPGNKVRGEHAHKHCDQFLIAVNGSLSIVVNNCHDSCEIRLESPTFGLYIPHGIWAIQYKFSHNAVLAVYASAPYDTNDYIREFKEFKRIYS